MKITFYGYNAFVVENGSRKIAIDPGALFLHYFRLTPLIPKKEWAGITHIFVTHGDPDHYWHADRVAAAAQAPLICNTTMLRTISGRELMLGTRTKGLSFTWPAKQVHTISADQTIEMDGMKITGVETAHGPLVIKIGPISKAIVPGPHERIGWGAIGFKIECEGTTIANLGDTTLFGAEWDLLRNCDVLMLPIGGRDVHNTMDEMEALEAVRRISPRMVIPCHYNCPAFFTKRYNPADEEMFKREVEKMGIECIIMKNGDEIII